MTHAYPLVGSLLMGSAVALAVYGGYDRLLAGLKWVERDVGDKLRALRIVPKSLRGLLLAWIAAIAGVFAVLGILLGSPLLALSICVLLAALPWYVIRRLAQQRRMQIEDQLADSMVLFSNGVRAGLSIAQSLDILAEQCPRPVRDEFRQITSEFNLGKPLEQTLVEAKDRLRSENFSLFAEALLASRKSGGRLNETVDRIARSVLEMQRLERKIQSETAQARKSAVYMAIAPALMVPPGDADPPLRRQQDSGLAVQNYQRPAEASTATAVAPPPVVMPAAAPPQPPPQTARLKTKASAADAVAVAADGKLPTLQLADADKGGEKTQRANPGIPLWLAIAAVAASTLLSALLLLVDVDGTQSSAAKAAEARREISQFYGTGTADLLPYQILLREAQQAHSRGDRSLAREKYREVLALLRAEGRNKYQGLTGTPSGDEQLARLLAILLAAE